MSLKIAILNNFAKFSGKQLCHSLFFNKVAGSRPATLLKNKLWHIFFPVNFAILFLFFVFDSNRQWEVSREELLNTREEL